MSKSELTTSWGLVWYSDAKLLVLDLNISPVVWLSGHYQNIVHLNIGLVKVHCSEAFSN